MLEMLITVNKQELLTRMRENRDKHRKVFLDALAGYRAEALTVLEEQVASLRDGKTPEIRFTLSRPADHTRDYDRVIGMLDMDKGSEFTLDEQTYAQYVDDDWAWKRQWLKMSNRYASASTISNYGDAGLDED